MQLFGPIYRKMIEYAAHKHAPWYLGGLSFAESSFFPIPPDVMLAPMALARRDKAWRYAFITTVTSVLGGLFGYILGAYFFDAYGQDVLSFFHAHEAFAQMQDYFLRYGMLIVLLAGFTPVPYKIFTIASGVMGIAILPFVLLSLLSRGARFYLVAAIVKYGGERFEDTLHQKIEQIGWATLLIVIVGVVIYQLSH